MIGLLEWSGLGLALLFAAARQFSVLNPSVVLILGALALIALVIALAANPARWQLYPASLGLLLIGLALWRGGFWLILLGVVLTVLSAIALHFMPVRSVPDPSGPRSIGTSQIDLLRESGSGDRSLLVKLWYPAAPSQSPREGLWADMPAMQDIPAPLRLGLAYLHRTPTHAVADADPLAGHRPRLIIYNHSYVSWASENTLLMEELASRGYLVASIRHTGQYAEQAELDAALPDDQRSQQSEIAAQLAQTETRDARAEVNARMVAASVTSGEIVRRRTQDAAYVARTILEHVAFQTHEDGQYISMGFSLGGAVASSLCLADPNCLATVNIDGGLYGLDGPIPSASPYLMVYSGDNIGGNDAGLAVDGAAYREIVFERSTHADFLDAAHFVPAMPGRGAVSDTERVVMRRQIADAVEQLEASAASGQ